MATLEKMESIQVVNTYRFSRESLINHSGVGVDTEIRDCIQLVRTLLKVRGGE